MKADIHPNYTETTVTCSCGNTFTTRSTAGEPPRRAVQRVPSLLHRQAEAGGHRWSHRPLRAPLRPPQERPHGPRGVLSRPARPCRRSSGRRSTPPSCGRCSPRTSATTDLRAPARSPVAPRRGPATGAGSWPATSPPGRWARRWPGPCATTSSDLQRPRGGRHRRPGPPGRAFRAGRRRSGASTVTGCARSRPCRRPDPSGRSGAADRGVRPAPRGGRRRRRRRARRGGRRGPRPRGRPGGRGRGRHRGPRGRRRAPRPRGLRHGPRRPARRARPWPGRRHRAPEPSGRAPSPTRSAGSPGALAPGRARSSDPTSSGRPGSSPVDAAAAPGLGQGRRPGLPGGRGPRGPARRGRLLGRHRPRPGPLRGRGPGPSRARRPPAAGRARARTTIP